MAWLWVTLAVIIDGAIALLGGLIPERWLERYRAPMLGFATGTLLASGLGEIFPEAFARDGILALAWAGLAMAALGAIEWASSRRGHHRERPIIPTALLASDALHNLGDGMAIAAAFLVRPGYGVLTAAAVIIHELPEEIADYALLRANAMSKRRALVLLALVQLSAGIGAAGTLIASSLVAQASGAVLGIASGMFVYIAAIDLIPELYKVRTRWAGVAIIIGAAIVLLI
ncbi:MAG TPA: ZIP family metal transporter [Kofleriaceae bacterium]|nr:ZIP family metal transporter [Kofleriaceae bacterium]